ncbi:MAG: LD-carboxypeptidase [Bacteroidetes bacterium]|nr:LD-carboxypeptidase [Bacteroidota bacterium]
MITPNYLQKGDKVGIVATARKITSGELIEAQHFFNDCGLEVILGENIFNHSNQFSGTDDERLYGFQMMLDDPAINAIVFARGGYGTIRILDQIDWSLFVKNPKWLIGFSDITAIHSHVFSNFQIETLHALMPLNFDTATKESTSSLYKSLFGERIIYEINPHPLNRKGEAEGKLIGGNLSLIHTLKGSKSDLDTRDKILFFEDLDEYLYHIDRMMHSLKRSGHLDKLAGLIIGGMTVMNDNPIPFGNTAYEIIRDTVEEYDYPVCFNFPAGHFPDNRALILGREVSLNIGDKVSLGFNT